MAARKNRLDVALVERGIVDSRAKAQSLIMARRILVNGQHVDKAGANVADEDELAIEALLHRTATFENVATLTNSRTRFAMPSACRSYCARSTSCAP